MRFQDTFYKISFPESKWITLEFQWPMITSLRELFLTHFVWLESTRRARRHGRRCKFNVSWLKMKGNKVIINKWKYTLHLALKESFLPNVFFLFLASIGVEQWRQDGKWKGFRLVLHGNWNDLKKTKVSRLLSGTVDIRGKTTKHKYTLRRMELGQSQ